MIGETLPMQAFTYVGLPAKVVFGQGSVVSLRDEVAALGGTRALILSTPDQSENAELIARDLSSLAAGVFAGAAMHVPADTVAVAIARGQALTADCLVQSVADRPRALPRPSRWIPAYRSSQCPPLMPAAR